MPWCVQPVVLFHRIGPKSWQRREKKCNLNKPKQRLPSNTVTRLPKWKQPQLAWATVFSLLRSGCHLPTGACSASPHKHLDYQHQRFCLNVRVQSQSKSTYKFTLLRGSFIQKGKWGKGNMFAKVCSIQATNRVHRVLCRALLLYLHHFYPYMVDYGISYGVFFFVLIVKRIP